MESAIPIITAAVIGMVIGIAVSSIAARRVPHRERSGSLYSMDDYAAPARRSYVFPAMVTAFGAGLCAAAVLIWISLKDLQQNPPAADTSVLVGTLDAYAAAVFLLSLTVGLAAGISFLIAMHHHQRIRSERR